ncbi:MAG: hypothetical protein IPH68_15675 [Chitinophagaceae bacterium]|nr:hypothetical protein [Chitinophagaceae bacterium]
MEFEGEHLLPGQIGISCIAAFIASILSTIAFLQPTVKPHLLEKRIAQICKAGIYHAVGLCIDHVHYHILYLRQSLL